MAIRNWHLIGILVLWFAGSYGILNGQNTIQPPKFSLPVRGQDRDDLVHSVDNQAFGVGEHLVFDIAWGVINAGTATMSIPDTQWVNNQPVYRVLTLARSNKFLSSIHNVRDTVETYIDMKGLFPWYFEKHLHEGSYHAHHYVDYLQHKQQAVHTKIRIRKSSTKTKVDTAVVPPFVQGVLSAFYYVRTQPLEVGRSVDVLAYDEGKLYPLKILVHRRERIEVPAGKFNCIVVEPVLMSEGIFRQEGKLTIWLTDDTYRLPVLMKSKVAIGSIDCRLRKYRLSDRISRKE